MAVKEAMHEVNQSIEFTYRCNGDPATANPVVDIMDETATVVLTKTVGDGLTQIGATRLFKGSFTPDAEGVWKLHGKDDYSGDVAKDYPIGAVGLQSMATAILNVQDKADLILVDTAAMQVVLATIDGKMDTQEAAIAVIDGIVDTIKANVDTANAALVTIDSIVDDVKAGVITANSGIVAIDTVVDETKTKLDAVDVKIDSLQTGLDDVNVKLDNIADISAGGAAFA